jgi:chorismate mutase/prephenate dehydratase
MDIARAARSNRADTGSGDERNRIMGQPETSSRAAAPADDSSDLAPLRARIDAVDRAILERLNERARLVQEVGRMKQETGTSVYEPARERRIVEGLASSNEGPFPNAGLAPVFREIISATRSLEEPVHIAYLGPQGTFSHEAALQQFGALAALAPVARIVDVFAAVESGEVGLGIVPVENTTEGVVTPTLDALPEFGLEICAEFVLRVRLDLMSCTGRLEDVRTVASHPQPLAQSRAWLDRNLAGAERLETASTAAAARLARDDASVAAIGSVAAVDAYGLTVVASGVEDRRDNTTRFIVIGRDAPSRSGNDLTTVLFTIRKDQPGGLHGLIEPMARRGVNLTSIQLRPIKGKPWEYYFFIDLEGHREDEAVREALAEAATLAHSTRVLGSFPRAAAFGGAE